MKTSTCIGEALSEAHSFINSISDTPLLDAQLLLAHVTGKSRTWIASHHEEELALDEATHFQSLITERGRGVPLPYILGWWEFYGRRFTLTKDVLIPRPETELLVETAIKFLNENPTKCIVADIGTGSGCIGISLAGEVSNLRVFATDVSKDALVLARKNASDHGLGSEIHFLQMDLATAIEGPIDLVCANLPYVPSRELKKLAVGKWEPPDALDGGFDGMRIIRNLLIDLPRTVRSGSLILLEVDSGNGDSARQIAHQIFPTAQIQLLKDLAGRDRLITINV